MTFHSPLLRAFTPKQLFRAGEKGVWYDPSDMSTLWQDSARTTAVTAVEQPVGCIDDKSGNGANATQSTSASRPVLSARVNLLTYTEDFSNGVWGKSNCTASAMNVSDPSGGSTASTITATANAAFFFYSTSSNPTSQSRNAVWVRRRTGTGTIRFRTDAAGTDTDYTSSITTSWSLFTWNCVPGFTQSQNHFVINIATSGDAIDIWHPDMRVSNDGVGLPAYQRVNTSTDYDTAGFPMYLRFDGTDDSLATSSIDFTGTDKMTVWAGVRKLASATGAVAELSANVNSNNGSFAVFADGTTSSDWSVNTRGTSNNNAYFTFSAPISHLLTASIISNGSTNDAAIAVRLNGSAATKSGSSGTPSTGNYSNYPLYIGRRGGSTLPFNGRLYSLIVRGASSTTGQITDTEGWVNGRTRAY